MLLSGIWVLFQDLSSVTSVSNNLLMLEHTIFIILSKEEKFGGLSYIYNFFFFFKSPKQHYKTTFRRGRQDGGTCVSDSTLGLLQQVARVVFLTVHVRTQNSERRVRSSRPRAAAPPRCVLGRELISRSVDQMHC